MSRSAIAAIMLLGLTISCAPTTAPQPTVALATAAVAPTDTPTSVALATATVTATYTPTSVALPPTLTPTPTRVIGAVEQTPSPEVKTPKAVWGGVIASSGSRRYMSNGKVVNTCNTSWSTGLTFSIDSAGRVAGYGNGNLVSMQCSPLSRSGNTTNMNLRVDGTKDNANLTLRLTVVSHTPQVSGEFGGYNLLFSTMTCPGNTRTLILPLTSPTSADGSLKFSGTMTGCAGSKDDVVSSDNVAKVGFFAECDNRPPDMQNPEVDSLCQ